MQLTILGSGTMMPTKYRHPSGYLIEMKNKRMLIDCGHTTIGRLIDMNINLHDIDSMCISHFHTDHFSDCFPMVHALWVDCMQQNIDVRTIRPLLMIGPNGLKERYKQWRNIFWKEPNEEYPIQFIEGSGQRIEAIETFSINHVPYFDSVGYKITENNKTLVYTGDLGSNQSEDFYKVITNVDVLLIECGVTAPRPNHYSPSQVIALVKKYMIKKALLTHIREENVAKIESVIRDYPHIAIVQDKQVVEV